MECSWIKVSPSFQKGVSIINELDNTKFDQFLRRIVTKMKLKDSEIFTEEERHKLCKIFKVDEEQLLLSIKSLIYLMKRTLKFIFMPTDLKNDLNAIGFMNEKCDCIVKVWSMETKSTIDGLNLDMEQCGTELNFSWKLNAELSSDYRKKCKVPKTYLTFNSQKGATEVELTHPELYSVFLQLESIQNEFDNIVL